jgi:hypothetical protein
MGGSSSTTRTMQAPSTTLLHAATRRIGPQELSHWRRPRRLTNGTTTGHAAPTLDYEPGPRLSASQLEQEQAHQSCSAQAQEQGNRQATEEAAALGLILHPGLLPFGYGCPSLVAASRRCS